MAYGSGLIPASQAQVLLSGEVTFRPPLLIELTSSSSSGLSTVEFQRKMHAARVLNILRSFGHTRPLQLWSPRCDFARRGGGRRAHDSVPGAYVPYPLCTGSPAPPSGAPLPPSFAFLAPRSPAPLLPVCIALNRPRDSSSSSGQPKVECNSAHTSGATGLLLLNAPARAPRLGWLHSRSPAQGHGRRQAIQVYIVTFWFGPRTSPSKLRPRNLPS